jgi:CheY-like chemotaxis protein
LSVAGFRTLTAATGAEAFAVAAEHLPDVILMDFRLPDMDGVEATRKLAMGTATARIPVVAMSSLPLGGAAWLLDAGFAGSIEKPIRVAEFPDQVRSFCA